MAAKNPTLEQAIKAEEATKTSQKKAQIRMLSSTARTLTKTQMKSLIDGKHTKLKKVNIGDIMSLKKLVHFRRERHLPYTPFENIGASPSGVYDPNIY